MAEKKNFDSDFCGSLPLQHINLIQDYGYLLILDIEDLKVIQASENTDAITGKPVQEIINSSFSEYIIDTDFEKIREFLKKGVTQKIPFSLSFNTEASQDQFHALMHIKADYLLLEMEKATVETNRSFADVFQEVKQIIAAIDQAATVKEVCEVAVHELRKISGFDGILMYQFDKDWNGSVIAEEKDDRLEKYIGQTFPASDVPRQARQLYLKNPYRLIPSRDYQPIRLYPVLNSITNSFIDLSDCNLRGVVAVHLEYMKNMNIKASMSFRVIRNGQLWGLISCHHIEEKYLDYEVCSVFEWLSTVISAKISSILDKEAYDFATELQHKRAALADRIYESDDIIAGIITEDGPDILDLFDATGSVVILNGRIETKGEVPLVDDIDNLMLWLEGKDINDVFATDHLSGIYDDAKTFAAVGSGMLVIPIDSAKGDYVVCFRPEVVETINWGGDPNEAITFENDGKKYHPRNSFKLWKQTVMRHAKPFTPEELEIAAVLRSFLFEFRTKQLYN
ncbi:phytochrome-like protein [Pedobacter sp. BAL39]|uniref:GAF domain-containing protein n=1 Tax=Pedobacter sp. BAL39 TaxID=391596 RepID=UPI0001559744|nr:GAF domain-containing protein [Pedobacter sp. BAL39]EDM36207.1 phytochrome-like protein [Pedobacter sp. BAL39]